MYHNVLVFWNSLYIYVIYSIHQTNSPERSDSTAGTMVPEVTATNVLRLSGQQSDSDEYDDVCSFNLS